MNEHAETQALWFEIFRLGKLAASIHRSCREELLSKWKCGHAGQHSKVIDAEWRSGRQLRNEKDKRVHTGLRVERIKRP